MQTSLIALLLSLASITGDSVDDVLASYAKGWKAKTAKGEVVEFAATITTRDIVWQEDIETPVRGLSIGQKWLRVESFDSKNQLDDTIVLNLNEGAPRISLQAKDGVDVLSIPIFPIFGVERHEVESQLVAHVRDVYGMLMEGPAAITANHKCELQFADKQVAILSLSPLRERSKSDALVYQIAIDRLSHRPTMIWFRETNENECLVIIHSCVVRPKTAEDAKQLDTTGVKQAQDAPKG